MNGAEWLVQSLVQRGVEYVFVLCGNGLQPFLEACHGSRLKIVDVRNEQAASYMADLWGRMTGRLGVVAVSSGPGHTNALTGLANAAWDGGPMLLLSGCSEWSTKGLDHFQELDQVGMVEPICKYASLVDRVDHLERKFSAALFHATAHRPGPVHLTIPMDVLRAECKAQIAGAPARVGQGPPPDGTVARQVVAKLHRATRPLIVAGSGVFYAGAGGLLQEFAELTSIPVLTQMWDRGDFPQAFPEYVGVASSEVNGAMSLFNEADVVLTVGARVDYRLGHGQPPVCRKGVEFIRIDADPAEVHRGRIGLDAAPDPVERQADLGGEQRNGGERRRGNPAGLDLAQRLRRDTRAGGHVVQRALAAGLPQQRADLLPAPDLGGGEGNPDHDRRVVPG